MAVGLPARVGLGSLEQRAGHDVFRDEEAILPKTKAVGNLMIPAFMLPKWPMCLHEQARVRQPLHRS